MYIKFFRRYGVDKTEEASANLSSDSKLSVDLEREKGNQSLANIGLWRAACLCLSIICLILLLIIIVLGVKLQTGSTVCSDGEKTTDSHAVVERCSSEWCLTNFPQTQPRQETQGKLIRVHAFRELRSFRYHDCPKGWWKLDQSCFFLSTFRLSWEESEMNCTNSGGSLSVIDSMRVQSFLSKRGNLKYWIGLRERGSWTWVDNSPLGESYWSEVPSDGECVTLNTEYPPDKNWLKASCQRYSYFTCQLHL